MMLRQNLPILWLRMVEHALIGLNIEFDIMLNHLFIILHEFTFLETNMQKDIAKLTYFIA